MSSSKASNTALEQLLALRADAESRLLELPDYVTFKALDRAIAEIGGAPAPGIDTPKKIKQKQDGAAQVEGMSQADAAHVLLREVLHEPVVIAHLVRALTAHGIRVGGDNPNINLSSVLSKDGRFRSVRYKDRSCWWVKSTPFPGELDGPQ